MYSSNWACMPMNLIMNSMIIAVHSFPELKLRMSGPFEAICLTCADAACGKICTRFVAAAISSCINNMHNCTECSLSAERHCLLAVTTYVLHVTLTPWKHIIILWSLMTCDVHWYSYLTSWPCLQRFHWTMKSPQYPNSEILYWLPVVYRPYHMSPMGLQNSPEIGYDTSILYQSRISVMEPRFGTLLWWQHFECNLHESGNNSANGPYRQN